MAPARSLDALPVTLIGHPFAPIGMGEQLRSHITACRAVGVDVGVFDIFRYAQRADVGYRDLIGDAERRDPPGGIRIFHVNGDEVESVMEAFAARGGVWADGFNIVVPAWELPAYPKEWARHLQRFDEVWALSAFIQGSLATAGIDAPLIGQSVQMRPGPCLPRRYFGIRESAFTLLHFFDVSSYATRKNPEAVLALLARIRAGHPFLDIQLVLKVKDGERSAEYWTETLPPEANVGGAHVKVIATPLDGFEVRSLVNACDCFVSLHRAEGFGRGLGEAMMLGRLAMGTGWSGNVDFMTAENSLLVRHEMVKLERDAYPHWRGQSWAEPDLDHAMALLRPVLEDPARGRAMALRGQAEVFRSHGDRAVGIRILDRLEWIVANAAIGAAVSVLS
jgi:hypothetical protein